MIKHNFWNKFINFQLTAAHRGYRAIRAENTISAFLAAYNRCDFIELDVGFTKDGVPVVIHDYTLTRTTDVCQHKNFTKPYLLTDYTYDEIKELDASIWFVKNDPFSSLACGLIFKEELKVWSHQKIPTLKEVLKLCKLLKLPVNIELKDYSHTALNCIVTLKVVQLIKELQIENLVLISSSNQKYLFELKKIAPSIDRALIADKEHPKDIVATLRKLGAKNYIINKQLVDEKLILSLLHHNIYTSVYTVNEPSQKLELFKMGVKAIYTDFL